MFAKCLAQVNIRRMLANCFWEMQQLCKGHKGRVSGRCKPYGQTVCIARHLCGRQGDQLGGSCIQHFRWHMMWYFGNRGGEERIKLNSEEVPLGGLCEQEWVKCTPGRSVTECSVVSHFQWAFGKCSLGQDDLRDTLFCCKIKPDAFEYQN